MPSVFGCIPSGLRYGNVPNELIHRAGPPSLDNHYRDYQYDMSRWIVMVKVGIHAQRVVRFILLEGVSDFGQRRRQSQAQIYSCHYL